MIDVACTCGVRESVPESQANSRWLCPSCGKTVHLICAEQLPEGAGEGDFDASLVVLSGPAQSGERFVIGGVADIEIGKLPGKNILLPGEHVSRSHCTLHRLDYGPSRWQIVDPGSTHGTFVNSEKVQQQELAPGDTILIGDFELQYEAPAPAMSEPAMQMPAAEPTPTAAQPAAHPAARSHSGIHQPFFVPGTHHYQKPEPKHGFWSRLFGH